MREVTSLMNELELHTESEVEFEKETEDSDLAIDLSDSPILELGVW